MEEQFHKYSQRAKAGIQPRQVYAEAIADGLGDIDAVRMLREVFGLSLREAKEVLQSSADPHGQKDMTGDLERALDELEHKSAQEK